MQNGLAYDSARPMASPPVEAGLAQLRSSAVTRSAALRVPRSCPHSNARRRTFGPFLQQALVDLAGLAERQDCFYEHPLRHLEIR
jgi:hypothetical protein